MRKCVYPQKSIRAVDRVSKKLSCGMTSTNIKGIHRVLCAPEKGISKPISGVKKDFFKRVWVGGIFKGDWESSE